MDIDFERLIRLQHLDSEIRRLSASIETIPSFLAEIDDKIKKSSEIITTAKEKLTKNQKKRRELEGKAKDVRELISKYKRQLNDVKSNREYTSLLKEIEETQKTVDSLEEEIISEMLAADDIEKEIHTATQTHRKDEESFNKEKDIIAKDKKELEETLAKISQEKQELLPQILNDQLNLYLKISNKKDGIALSPVTDDFCSLCHMRIRPQVLNELMDTLKLILCENCGRILYWKPKPQGEKEALQPSTRSHK